MNSKAILMAGAVVTASMTGLSAQARHAGYNNDSYVDYARYVRVATPVVNAGTRNAPIVFQHDVPMVVKSLVV